MDKGDQGVMGQNIGQKQQNDTPQHNQNDTPQSNQNGTGWGSKSLPALHAAFPHTVPVLTGFMALGIAYGVLMQAKGYGVLWAVLMSAIAFCGSMQYVAITLLTTVFDPVQAFLLSIMVNARHLFYGLSMLEKYRGVGKIKGMLIFMLCDETFSISYAVEPPEGVERKYFYFWISLLDYGYWVSATLIGGVLGNFLPINTEGLDFVLTALFVVLFLEQWKVKENRAAGVIGMACAVISLIVFGSENLVIPAMILIMVTLLCGGKTGLLPGLRENGQKNGRSVSKE